MIQTSTLSLSCPDRVIRRFFTQISSNDLSGLLASRCINIHHGFLPGFKGAKPYDRAYERGLKMIGAPSHVESGDDLVAKGRDVERRIASRGSESVFARSRLSQRPALSSI